MFSAPGTKKVLLRIQRAEQRGDKDLVNEIISDYNASTAKVQVSERGAKSPKKESATIPSTEVSIIPRKQLEEMLEDVQDTRGRNVRDVLVQYMEAAAKVNPDKDAISMRAFQSQRISYKLFKTHLYNVFQIKLSDQAFKISKRLFDMNNQGSINGYDFLVTFGFLGAILKDQKAAEAKAKEERNVKIAKKKEEKQLLLKEKKILMDIDWDYSDDISRATRRKVEHAAWCFDPGAPNAPNLDGFTSAALPPAEFKDLVKRVFNLKLTNKSLAACIRLFNSECDGKRVPCGEFIQYFIALGHELRDKERREQREKQRKMITDAEAEAVAIQKEKDTKMNLKIDMDYSPVDEASANQKLLVAATKYDKGHPGAMSLNGFDSKTLSAGQFREMLKTTFNLKLKPKELGALVKKFEHRDKPTSGEIDTHTFLVAFLQMGVDERAKKKREGLEKQREAIRVAELEMKEKLEAQDKKMILKVQEGTTDEILLDTEDRFRQAAARYEKGHPSSVGLDGFEAKILNPAEFREIVKRTFNLKLNPKELAAAMELFDLDKKGHIVSADFLVTFFKMGADERSRVRKEQFDRQQEENKYRELLAKQKAKDDDAKHLYKPDYDYTDDDIYSGTEKIRICAAKFDKTSSGALDLRAFDVAYMEAGQFRDLTRRAFNLNITPKEFGALLDEFDFKGKGVNSREFLQYFIKLGVDEREKFRLAQLNKQRQEDKDRLKKEKEDAEAAANKNKESVDKNFTERHTVSAKEKLLKAATGYDKNHPGAPSLTAFEVKALNGIALREVLKSTFNIVLSPKELGALVRFISPDGDGESVQSKEFMTKFVQMGFKERSRLRKESLDKQRKENLEQKKEAAAKVAALVDKAEFKMDWSFKPDDFDTAMEKLAVAAKKYDKSSPSAPDVTQLDVGTLKPGVFRELLRRTFGIKLTIPELAATAKQFDDGKEQINTHNFLIFFSRMGQELRQRERKRHDDQQREYEEKIERQKARKARIANQKNELDLDDNTYTETERTKAIAKVEAAAAKYDKNAPGAVNLTAFEAKYLTPLQFKEVLKRTFGLMFTSGELLALIKEYQDSTGNIPCKPFLIKFLQIGVDTRQAFKVQQLMKQRKAEKLRKNEEEMKLREQENKMMLKVDFSKSADCEKSAFDKLTAAAKKYDKSNPGALSLEAFDCQYMEAATFREMLARTFGVRLNLGELAVLMRFFDPEMTGKVPCQEFVIHFLKTGFSERRKVQKASFDKQRADNIARKKEEEEKLAAQWAKAELEFDGKFEKEDMESAMEKLRDAARKNENPNLKPFDGNSISVGEFREMLKRVFNIKITLAELAALVSIFDTDPKQNRIDCNKFVVKFVGLGFEEREKRHRIQLEKRRAAIELEKRNEEEALKKHQESMPTASINHNFELSDFNSAMEKIRVVAAGYDRNHPSAPNLAGFKGSNLPVAQFKELMRTTFQIRLNPSELGALLKYFDTSGDGTIDSVEFLLHFGKMNRIESSKKHRNHIERERDVIRKQEEEEEIRVLKKNLEDTRKMAFIEADEKTLLAKVRQCAQNFAVDSNSYMEPLQGFKGSALLPTAFKELYYRVFGVKLTYPECGVLLSIFDDTGVGSIDGPKFLKSFFRLGRLEERAMLGQLDRAITLKDLKASSDSPDKNLDNSKIKIEKFNFTRSSSSGKVGKELSKEEHSILKQYRNKPQTAGNKTDTASNTTNTKKKKNKQVSLGSTVPTKTSWGSFDGHASSDSVSSHTKGKIKKTPFKPGPNFVLPQLLTSFNDSLGQATEKSMSALTMNLSDFQLGSPAPVTPGAASALTGYNTLEDYSTASEFTFGTESSPNKKSENSSRRYRVGDGDLQAGQGMSNQGSFASEASVSKSSTSKSFNLPGGVDEGGFFFPPAIGGKTKLPAMKIESPVKSKPEVDDSEYL